jgi:hypothetical protein
MKKLLTGLLTFAVVAVSVGMSTSAAEASSSVQGYVHSQGRSSVSWGSNYQYPYVYNQTEASHRLYLEQYIRQLQALLAQLQAAQGGNWYTPGHNYSYGNSEVEVTTRSATAIEDEEATLRGEVDFNNSDEAVVYFEWGTSANNLNNETTNFVYDADDDDESFTARLTNLDEDRTYYFRAVAEDEDGRRDYGSILSFRTDGDSWDWNDDDDDDWDWDNDGDYPEANTDDAFNITNSAASIEGSVDMNDFDDGYVFFVYGEDEDQIDDVVSDYDSYQDVDEDGDDLQKIAVDSSLDGDEDYRASIWGLDEDTEIYYAICVAFEDEDNDDVIICGDTESFETDND